MKRISAAILAGVLMGAVALAGEVRWAKSLEEGQAAAKEKRCALALCFLDDEAFSVRLEGELEDPAVREIFGKLVPVRLDYKAAGAVAARYGVRSAPAIVILSAEGKLQGVIPGYQAAKMLAAMISDALQRPPVDLPPMAQGPGGPGGPPAPGEGEAEQNPLRPLAGNMDGVHQDLRRDDTGPIVQAKIDDILKELDRLIKEADKQGGG